MERRLVSRRSSSATPRIQVDQSQLVPRNRRISLRTNLNVMRPGPPLKPGLDPVALESRAPIERSPQIRRVRSAAWMMSRLSRSSNNKRRSPREWKPGPARVESSIHFAYSLLQVEGERLRAIRRQFGPPPVQARQPEPSAFRVWESSSSTRFAICRGSQ